VLGFIELIKLKMINKINFIKTLRSITKIPDEHIKKILAISHIKNINKGECFIREGEISQNFSFILSGLFRYYYIDKKGNDSTKGFFLENSFISSYSALIQKRKSFLQ
jgi:CRP-like cAMP-binding protein